ncbi:ABC transporter permease [Fructobacillus sp. M2-14]|uniref:ABC transporter permease n=1 Tax=Fructobacillus broussonetiae TaxID=2713173 RepID=A0ABS5R1Z7_9LACO|nr:ABC transporter permease [Fructobacillus broussonetiae]MBS9338671.1 ABC transporter permease [Fructobacillus broussonetiae]
MFHLKLALDSLKKNSSTYIPFLLASATAVALNFLFQLLIYSKGVKDLSMAEVVILLLVLGQIVIGILSVVILIYTYSFLKKGKQKEFGLYSILGLKKSDLVKISLIQQLFSFFIAIVLGLVTGFIFAKLMILLLIHLIDGTTFNLAFSWKALFFTVLFFLVAFLILAVIDAVSFYKTNTLALFQSEKKASTAPKNRWVLFVIGLASLIVGYWLSLTVPGPVDAILRFFLAALLIIIATYFLFIAGSTLLLKMLQKRESYYYKSQHFITVSNMLFRMKQNAVGLASIALLSTMTLVVTVTTASMFLGKTDVANRMLPRETTVSVSENLLSKEKIEETAKKHHLSTDSFYTIRASSKAVAYLSKDNELTRWRYGSESEKKQKKTRPGERNVQFMTLKDYNDLTHRKATLDKNEVLIYSLTNDPGNKKAILTPTKNVRLNSKDYKVKENISSIPGIPSMTSQLMPSLFIVMPDEKTTEHTAEHYVLADDLENNSLMMDTFYFNLEGKFDDKNAFLDDLEQSLPSNSDSSLMNKTILKKLMNAFYGGFFFIGILFSISFMFVTGLMVYYKQISEGKADKAQFDILQKVGMSKPEIKKTIHSQISWLFGLPVIVSIIHLSFSIVMIQKLLLAFAIPMSSSVYIIMAVTVFLMVMIYLFIYQLTSKTYFKQVASLNN